MVDRVNIELDEPFLKKFFGLTEKIIPEGQEITLSMLRRQLDDIEGVLTEAKNSANQKTAIPQSKQPLRLLSAALLMMICLVVKTGLILPKKTILIIDDLGVITYQLSVLFQQYNFEVTTSKEIYDAIEKFKKQGFDLVVMDLFIPTEREGFILLEELKKLQQANKNPQNWRNVSFFKERTQATLQNERCRILRRKSRRLAKRTFWGY